jgi:predicted membrane chloride channel (bestrophin family)
MLQASSPHATLQSPLQDVMGGCERIFSTPIPPSYTRHTSRFLVCWLTLLHFCVAAAFGWLTVPISIGLAFFLFGIEVRQTVCLQPASAGVGCAHFTRRSCWLAAE